jgi:hypothetical protein
MIELNCSYEESKKILELGYDFSSTCREFEHKPTNSKKIKINEDIFIEENVNIGSFDEAYPVRAVKSLLEFGFIPLIPKTALEACLIDKIFGNVALSNKTPICYGRIFKKIFEKDCPSRFSVWEITGGVSTNGGVTTYFPSVFEAFLWLHENYPEELKTKFDEVMA